MARAKLKPRTNVSEFTIRDEAFVPDGQWDGRCQRRVTQHSSLGEWEEKMSFPCLFSILKAPFCGSQTLEEIMLQTLLINFDSPAPCFALSVSELFLAHDFSVISRFFTRTVAVFFFFCSSLKVGWYLTQNT